MDIGRKIYYELSTGNVIVETGERSGDVVETTEAQDFQMYSALQPYQQSAVGVLQLSYGQDSSNFSKYPFHVDITQNPPVIAWDTNNPIGASLADVQKSKIAQLRDMYSQTLAAGFNVTIGSTQYTFGWTTDDKATMADTQESVAKGFLTFPIQYGDVNGNPVSITDQTTLDTIESTATKFVTAQHQQVLNLVSQVQAIQQSNYATLADTTTAVNAIQWSAATY